MPLYEYHCNKCSKRFEELVSSSERAVNLVCPECSSREIEKLFSVFGMNSSSGFSGSVASGASCGGCTSTKCGTCH